MNERFARDLNDGNFGGLEDIVADHEKSLVDAGIEFEDDEDGGGPVLCLKLVRGDGETFEARCDTPILQFLRTEISDGILRLEM